MFVALGQLLNGCQQGQVFRVGDVGIQVRLLRQGLVRAVAQPIRRHAEEISPKSLAIFFKIVQL